MVNEKERRYMASYRALIITFLLIGIQAMAETSIGVKYMNFLEIFHCGQGVDLAKEIDDLFAPTIKKVVNLREIAHNRDQLFKQAADVKNRYGITSFKVHEYLDIPEKNTCVIRWEIAYHDGDVESVITVVKGNAEDKIIEINEVFGQKGIYEWQD